MALREPRDEPYRLRPAGPFDLDEVARIESESFPVPWKREFFAETNYSEPCAAHFNDEAVCRQVEGCSWAGTYCSGFPTPCWRYPQGQCILSPGCKWYAPSLCDTPCCQ